MYQSFILPHFDYADVIWDNCTDTQSQMLENLHLEGIRIIIGGVKGTSHQKLYKESGFCTLKKRRERHKLLMMKKISLCFCPSYLNDLLPALVSENNPYPRRRPHERVIPRHHTEISQTFFQPSTTRLFNELPVDAIHTTSLSNFKRYLPSSSKPPPYYYTGNRLEELTHCRLRLQMSNLNSDLHSRHLSENPTCTCGHPRETAEHYFLHCNKYLDVRNQTISKLPAEWQNITTLLSGKDSLTNEENTKIFLHVQSFIKQSARFQGTLLTLSYTNTKPRSSAHRDPNTHAHQLQSVIKTTISMKINHKTTDSACLIFYK